MELQRSEFAVLRTAVGTGERVDPPMISAHSELSLEDAREAAARCVHRGWLADGRATPEGVAALDPYRVDNAIIMAAGMSTRFAPISYEKPKGVLRVRGEVLIERQIEQLLSAGIADITVVVGYKKEYFFYLAARYGVQIVVNPDYDTRNNNSTLWRVRDRLANTFVCSSDDYFTENPFERYVFRPYYASEFVSGPTDEWCMDVDEDNRITGVTVGGRDAWVMLGHVYFDRAFSQQFIRILEAEYDLPATADKLWESLFVEHLTELDMDIRPYAAGVINEFDSLDEVRGFDPLFIENVDSAILNNIATVLNCAKEDIGGVVSIKQGLTNMSFCFVVDGKKYVYRHPGAGTDKIISRESETFSQSVARKLGLDGTFIHEDPVTGWKLSRFIDGCTPFDYHNQRHVAAAMRIARTLHNSRFRSQWSADQWEKTETVLELLSPQSRATHADFDELLSKMRDVHARTVGDSVTPCLCHMDFYDPNFLVHGDRIELIDWEYSGMSDYAADLGTFICCSDYTSDQVQEVLRAYFQRDLTHSELAHCLGYVALAGYYWFVWAIYQAQNGSPVGGYLELWHSFAQEYSEQALALYEGSSLNG